MRRGAELRGIAFDAPRAAAATLQTLCANGHRNAYIRPLAWVGAGGFGLDVTGHGQPLMVATTPTLVPLGGTRTRLTVSPWRRNPARPLHPTSLCDATVNATTATPQPTSPTIGR